MVGSVTFYLNTAVFRYPGPAAGRATPADPAPSLSQLQGRRATTFANFNHSVKMNRYKNKAVNPTPGCRSLHQSFAQQPEVRWDEPGLEGRHAFQQQR